MVFTGRRDEIYALMVDRGKNLHLSQPRSSEDGVEGSVMFRFREFDLILKIAGFDGHKTDPNGLLRLR